MNISNLTGGKNEKARQGGFTWKTWVRFVFRLDLLGVFAVSLYIFKLLFLQLWCHNFENNSSNDIPTYTKQPIKVLQNKNNM